MPTQTFLTIDALHAAQKRLQSVVVRTPLIQLEGEREIYLKAECRQPIGSFKLRGAYNKAAQLSEDELRRGLIGYSSGNHAQGVAYAARALGTKAVIVMPSNAPAIKREATAALGAEIVIVGPASSERKAKAEELVREHGYTMIPPYDDATIIAGQGTCGMEILEQLPEVDLILAPVSGGGLLSGVAAAIKLQRPDVKVIGVEPELAGDAYESFRAGRIVPFSAEQTSRTLADGLRAQSLGELNFAYIRRFADGIVRVTEDEILRAMRAVLQSTDVIAEPSGAVALAAALFHAEELPAAGKIVAIVSGGNAEPALLQQLLDGSI
ncbi:MAG: threonine ammonia-lyase [Acidobacteriaceae bacterium]